jgi:hypothetical protein
MIEGMSDEFQIERDAVERDQRGRFVSGHKAAGPGRPVGSRSRLGEAFLSDLRDCWERHGAMALARCAAEEPAQFVRVVASLMPRDVNLNVAVDAGDFAMKFRQAVELLGNEPPAPPRRMKVIGNGR